MGARQTVSGRKRGQTEARPYVNIMGKIITITLGAFKESVRERVLYNLIVFAFLMIGTAILLGSISVGVEHIILINLGLTAISLFGLLIAIFIGIGLVSKEIDRRTIYNILSKPITRPEFILGKYAGLLLTLTVNTAIMTAGFYVALAIQNHGLSWGDLSLLIAVYFILLQLAVVVSVAIFFSCISGSILSAVFTFCIFVIGNFSDSIRAFGQESGSATIAKATAGIYYLLPNFSNFNIIDHAAHQIPVSGILVTANTCYALLYIAILLSAAILIFEEREFK